MHASASRGSDAPRSVLRFSGASVPEIGERRALGTGEGRGGSRPLLTLVCTQLKLDELLRAISSARSSLINLKSLSDDDMEMLQRQFETLRRRSSRGAAAPSV